MSFDDRIGCAPQLVTACIALVAAIASSIYIGSKNKVQNTQVENVETLNKCIVTAQTAFVNSKVER